MDPAILMSAVSTTAATTLVAAMSTDVWQSVRDVIARAFGGDEGSTLIQDLDGSVRELEAASEQDVSAVEVRLVADVTDRLQMMMDGSSEAIGRLAQVVAEIITQIADNIPAPKSAQTQHAIARDSAQQAVQFSGRQNNTFSS